MTLSLCLFSMIFIAICFTCSMWAITDWRVPTKYRIIWFQRLAYELWGGCSSRGWAGRQVMGRLLVRVQLPQLHVKVSLSKILNPKLLLMSSWHLAWQPLPSVYECVGECEKCCKALWAVSRVEKLYKNASPLAITCDITDSLEPGPGPEGKGGVWDLMCPALNLIVFTSILFSFFSTSTKLDT